MYREKGCPFCRDDIEDIAFMQSSNFWVIYNQSPILPGHSLVIPKFHIESLLDLDDSMLKEFINLSIEAAKNILKVFNADSFNWTIQEKPAAGQTIKHLHLHVFPRHENDLKHPGDWYPLLKQMEDSTYIDSNERYKFTQNELVQIVNDIKKQIVRKT